MPSPGAVGQAVVKFVPGNEDGTAAGVLLALDMVGGQISLVYMPVEYLFSRLRPKLCLGRNLPGKLCLLLLETEFCAQYRSQTPVWERGFIIYLRLSVLGWRG
jgi:hypothetical protein